MDFAHQLGITLLAWGVPALLVIPASLLLWFSLPRSDRGLPRQRHFAVPWGGLEVLVVFLGLAVWPTVMQSVLVMWLGEPAPTDKYENLVLALSAFVLAFPLHLTVSLAFMRITSGTRLYQVGLHVNHWRQRVLLGALGFLAIVPFILVLHLFVAWAYVQFTGEQPKPHGLEELMKEGRSPALEWTLLLTSSLLVAPLFEEFIFRGVLQRWASAFVWRGHVLMAAAILGAVGTNTPSRTPGGNPEVTGTTVAAVVFMLLLAPIYQFCPLFLSWAFPISNRFQPPEPKTLSEEELLALSDEDRATLNDPFGLAMAKLVEPAWQDPRVTQPRAVFATAALFASIHPWPTPIPLFLLALLLGWLAYRTQSLVPTVTLHVLFNVVACLGLALS